MPLRIALAQLDVIIGDFEKNIAALSAKHGVVRTILR